MPGESSAVLKRDLYFPKRKIPKLLIAYYLVFQAVGYDFGFTSVLKRKSRLIVQRITLFVSILSFVGMLTNLAFLYDNIWWWFYAVKSNGFILVLITTRYKLYHLIYDINGICDLTKKQINILNIITLSYTVLMYTIKHSFNILMCISAKDLICGDFLSIFQSVMYFGITLCLDVIVMSQILITYYLKCSIKIIKILLKKPNRNLDTYETSYMAIAECYDKIRHLYDWMVNQLFVTCTCCLIFVEQFIIFFEI